MAAAHTIHTMYIVVLVKETMVQAGYDGGGDRIDRQRWLTGRKERRGRRRRW